jgi:hypothetical protein
MRIELIFEDTEQLEALVAMSAPKMLAALQEIDATARGVLKHGADPEAALQQIRSAVFDALAFLDGDHG